MHTFWKDVCLQAKRPLRTIVAIEGMPGVGKTSCIKALHQIDPSVIPFDCHHEFLQSHHKTRFTSAIDRFDFTQSQRQVLYQSIYLDAELERREKILAFTKPNDKIVLDRGVEGTVFATEHLEASGIIDAANLRSTYYSRLVDVRSSHIILLDASMETIHGRLAHRELTTGRMRDHESYYILFAQGYRTWFKDNIQGLTILDAESDTPNDLAKRIHEILCYL